MTNAFFEFYKNYLRIEWHDSDFDEGNVDEDFWKTQVKDELDGIEIPWTDAEIDRLWDEVCTA